MASIARGVPGSPCESGEEETRLPRGEDVYRNQTLALAEKQMTKIIFNSAPKFGFSWMTSYDWEPDGQAWHSLR
jgi:hypothetical protein